MSFSTNQAIKQLNKSFGTRLKENLLSQLKGISEPIDELINEELK